MLPFSLMYAIAISRMNIQIKKDTKPIYYDERGFTWVELLVVLVVMGIISAVAATSLVYDDPDLAAQTEVIKVHLRYAQLRSMNTDTTWYIQFATNGYALYKSGDVNPILLPGEDAPSIPLPSGMTINYGAVNLVAFDSWGRPCIDSAGLVLQASDRTVSVALGTQTQPIYITRHTGFIQ